MPAQRSSSPVLGIVATARSRTRRSVPAYVSSASGVCQLPVASGRGAFDRRSLRNLHHLVVSLFNRDVAARTCHAAWSSESLPRSERLDLKPRGATAPAGRAGARLDATRTTTVVDLKSQRRDRALA